MQNIDILYGHLLLYRKPTINDFSSASKPMLVEYIVAFVG